MTSARTKCLLSLLAVIAATATAQTVGEQPPATQPSAAPVLYSVSLRDPDRHLLHITITARCAASLQAPSDTKRRGCELQLPVWNALYQVRDFSQYVQEVRAKDLSGNPLSVATEDKTSWSALSGAEPFFLEYDVAADTPGPFGTQITKAHAFLNLAQLLMYPVQQRNSSVAIRFTDIPAGWRIATPLQHFMDNTFTARNYDQMVDAPVEIGSFVESGFDLGGAKFRVVIDADSADYDLKIITEMARKIAATEVEWMNDRPFGHYVFIYHFPRHPAGGGMEHAYSAAIDAPAERVKANPLSLADVTAHEFFHLWNVKRIRPQSLEPVDYTKEQYTRALWFSEGVTSTVADYMRVRAGYLDEKGFLAELAADIRQLESRPARLTQSVEESSLEAWLEKYPDYERPERSISYYNKGEIVGMLLDLQMRQASAGKKSLRDLFQWMNQHYAKLGKFFPDSAGVEEAAEALTGADFRDFFARYVAGVEPIPYDSFFAMVGLRLQRQMITAADAGFRTTRRFGQPATVLSVTPGGEVEKAGLRPGDIVQQINGRAVERLPETEISTMRIGDTVDLRVVGASGPRRVKFKIAARQVENYLLVEREDATAAQRARRAAWMRGDSE